ncbi:MAG TPA: hypothetical protein VGM63_24250 [Mucilaginibacter sp.]|jgi:hypothetical protein
MKKVISVLLIIQGVLLFYNNSYGQSGNLNSATIKWLDFNMESIVDISCETFDHTFNDEQKVKFIFNKADLFKLQSLLKKSKEVRPLRSFDVRGSINFIYDNAKDKYCFNIFGYFYKGGKYYFNKSLMILIADKIFKQHPKYLDTLRQYE